MNRSLFRRIFLGMVFITVLFTGCEQFNTLSPGNPKYTIGGRILRSNGAAANGASLELFQGDVSAGAATADANGDYSFSDIISGTYTISVSLDGYSPGTISGFTVSANAADKNLTLSMKSSYAVGDIGPAGGVIYYIHSNPASSGWTYLEAAPDQMKRWWGLSGTRVGVTGTSIGSGKGNTERILAALKVSGESYMAAQYCDSYTLGGYSDWFFPSGEEVREMHRRRAVVPDINPYVGYSTSSEPNDSNADFSSFVATANYGTLAIGNKSQSWMVRPVRRF